MNSESLSIEGNSGNSFKMVTLCFKNSEIQHEFNSIPEALTPWQRATGTNKSFWSQCCSLSDLGKLYRAAPAVACALVEIELNCSFLWLFLGIMLGILSNSWSGNHIPPQHVNIPYMDPMGNTFCKIHDVGDFKTFCPQYHEKPMRINI